MRELFNNKNPNNSSSQICKYLHINFLWTVLQKITFCLFFKTEALLDFNIIILNYCYLIFFCGHFLNFAFSIASIPLLPFNALLFGILSKCIFRVGFPIYFSSRIGVTYLVSLSRLCWLLIVLQWAKNFLSWCPWVSSAFSNFLLYFWWASAILSCTMCLLVR